MNKRKSQQIILGGVAIGGDAPISIQSMTTTTPLQYEKSKTQIIALQSAGCELIRLTVPSINDAKALSKLKDISTVPLIADIHFDYRVAIEAINNGIDGLRINPGNIGSIDRVKAVVNAAKANHVPIRIGVNGGSLEPEIVAQYGATPEGMVASALKHIKILEQLDFYDTKISIKASDIQRTVEANRLIAQQTNYPLHLGVTEAGTKYGGTIKSAIGLGILLYDGIGDTIRVSLTADPVEEIQAAKTILKQLCLKKSGINFVSCPTCGRTMGNTIALANEVEAELKNVEAELEHLNASLTVAVMGCRVNGPGEAKGADWALVMGRKTGEIYHNGELLEKCPVALLKSRFLTLITESLKK